MKYYYLWQPSILSKLLLPIIFLGAGMVLRASAEEISAQRNPSIKEVNIAISGNQQNLVDLFTEIETQTELRFLYPYSLIEGEQVTLTKLNTTVWDVLQQISDQKKLSFKRVNNTVVVQEQEAGVQAISEKFDTTVSGIVTDEDGMGLPGVTIVAKGTNNGTTTDSEGRYKITIPNNTTLIFSYVGFLTDEVYITSQSEVNVTLQLDVSELDEVVVVSYGTVKKSELTSAVSKIDGKELTQSVVNSLGEALQGRAAGVNITTVSGEPGAGLVINIRGTSTINSGQDVLYVVDGFPVNRIQDINPADVKSIEILKDASATAIYGSRGANGVILVTTKKGSEAKMQVSIDSKVSVQQPTNLIRMNNAEQYARTRNQALINSGLEPQWSEEQISYMGKGTNWFDEISRTGRLDDHTLSIGGKMKDYSYYTSFNYFSNDGIIDRSFYERIVLRLNQSLQVTDMVEIGSNLNLSNRKSRYIADRSPRRGIVYEAMIVDPLTPARYVREADDDPLYGDIKANNYSQFGAPLTNNWNPLAHLARQETINYGDRMFGNFYLNFEPIEGLVFKTDFGLDIRRNEDSGFSPLYYIKLGESDAVGSVGKDASNEDNYVWTNTISYKKGFGGLKVTSVIGTVAEKYKYEAYGVSRQGLRTNDEEFRYLSSVDGISNSYGTRTISSLNSYFGRVQLNYDERYLFSASLRADGSSKFAEDYRWGYFPAFSLGWNLTSESFMKGVADSWLSGLKLRYGWGRIGNAAIPNGATLSLVGSFDYWWWGNNYTFGSTAPGIALGAAPTSPGNKDLRWETSNQSNFGVDLNFFDNKIGVTTDYFIKTTSDLLLVEELPTFSGYQTFPWSNVGEVKNKGLEFLVTYKEQFGGFGFNATATFASVKNKITNLGRTDYISGGTYPGLDDLTRSQVGSSIGQFYGLVADGIFQNVEEVEAYSLNGELIQPLAEPGDVRFMDLDNDGDIDNDDKTFIGNPIPDFTYSFNLGFTWKNFDVSAFFQGVYGNDVLNGVKVYTNYGDGVKNMEVGVLERAWNGEGTSNTHPRLVANDLNQNNRASSLYIEDGSYLRLKNGQIGYNFSRGMLDKLKVDQLRIYFSGQNLITWTNYSGIDPELANPSPLSTGIDYTVYPKSKTYALGLTMTF